MSSNNQLIIIENKKRKRFEIHYHGCVDNEFEVDEDSKLKQFKTLKNAIRWANDYCNKEMIEYGVWCCV